MKILISTNLKFKANDALVHHWPWIWEWFTAKSLSFFAICTPRVQIHGHSRANKTTFFLKVSELINYWGPLQILCLLKFHSVKATLKGVIQRQHLTGQKLGSLSAHVAYLLPQWTLIVWYAPYIVLQRSDVDHIIFLCYNLKRYLHSWLWLKLRFLKSLAVLPSAP